MFDENQWLSRWVRPAGAWFCAAVSACCRRFGAGTVALFFLLLVTAASGQLSGVYHEIYTPIGGSSLSRFTNSSIFPGSPVTPTDIISDFFETPVNLADDYGQRLRALVVPPVTGTYVFWVASDQAASLWLSSDESPNNEVQIAYNTNSVTYRAWYTWPSQQSTNIFLEAGRRYYIEALHVSYHGIRDCVSVGWKLPDGTLEQPIPAARLVPFGMAAVSPPSFTKQPTNLTVLENSPAIFRVGVSNLDVAKYQWQRNGTNLGGVVGATYTILQAATNDSGATFRCVISNSFGPVTSTGAVLNVLADSTPPALLNAANLSSNTVQVLFSEAVELASATSLTNYSINNGVVITAARVGAIPRAIILTTSPLVRNSSYILTVNNVRDLAAARNVIAGNSQQTFTALLKGVYREVYAPVPGSLLSDLTNSPVFPNSP